MLYFLLVKVFNTGLGERKLFYFALGWGKHLNNNLPSLATCSCDMYYIAVYLKPSIHM